MTDLRYNPLSLDEDICWFRGPTCVVCGKYATCERPEMYCDEHWARWWGEGDKTGAMYREAKFMFFAERLPFPVGWLAWRAFGLMELMFRGRRLDGWETLR